MKSKQQRIKRKKLKHSSEEHANDKFTIIKIWSVVKGARCRCDTVTVTVCVDELFQSTDDKQFENFLNNSTHVIQQPLIPDRPPTSCDRRPGAHDKLLLDKT